LSELSNSTNLAFFSLEDKFGSYIVVQRSAESSEWIFIKAEIEAVETMFCVVSVSALLQAKNSLCDTLFSVLSSH